MELTVFDLTPRSISDAVAYGHTFDQARIADRGGLDAYYLTEHHSNPGLQLVPSPHLLVAALSQRTTRIRLGVMCTNLTLHHPVRVAEEIRMMDLLTGGRLEMGFGRGAAPHEQVGFGVDPEEAESLFDHSMSIVAQLLAADALASYDEGPWQGTGVLAVPEATQRPHPPLWMAATSERSMQKAARLGLNLCTAFMDLEAVTRSRNVYRDAWAESRPGLPHGRYGTLQHILVGVSERAAYDAAGPHLEGWLGTDVRVADAVADGRIVCGSPDQCVDQLLHRAACGLDMFQGWFRFGGLDPAESDRSLRLFCDEVVPTLRAVAA